MKNKFVKVILAVLLCLCMALPMVACETNSGNGGDNTGGGTEVKPTGSLTFDNNGNVIFKNVTVRLETVVNGDDRTAFNTLIAKFNNEYDGKININVVNTGWDSYESTVGQEITNGAKSSPDLLMMHQKSVTNFAKKGLIQPFDNAITTSGINVDLTNYSDKMVSYTTYNGGTELYAIPLDYQSHVVYYNKKELAKVGGVLPTSYAELVALCENYKTTTGNTPIQWSTTDNYFFNYTYMTSVLQNGGKLYDETTLKASWYDDETTRNAFSKSSEMVRSFINKGYAEAGASDTDNIQAFYNQESLFLFYDPWAVSDVIKNYATALGDDATEETVLQDYVGGACVSNWFAQTDNAQKNYIFGDSHYFALSKTCTDIKKQAAILEFINWMTTNSKAGVDWAANGGHVSLSDAILNSESYQNNSYVKLLNSFYGNTDNLVCIGSTTYATLLTDTLKALYGETTEKSVLGKAYEDNRARDYEKIQARQQTYNSQVSFF